MCADLQKLRTANREPRTGRNWHGPFGSEYALAPRWNRLAHAYIRLFGILDLPTRLRAKLALGTLRKIEWNSLMDLGCGAGAYAFYLSRTPEKAVYGVDIDPVRLSQCCAVQRRTGRSNLHFINAEAKSALIQFRASSLDVVLAMEVLQYVDALPDVLGEIYRVLRPGGTLIAHVPVLGRLREPERRLFDRHSVQDLLSKAGFHVASVAPSFGPCAAILTGVYARISSYPVIAAIMFPLLLCASAGCRVTAPGGRYCFAVARKSSGLQCVS